MAAWQETPMERWPDDKLLRAAHLGDEDAFRIFCVRSLPGLIRYLAAQCDLRGVPRDSAIDFAQETLYKALAQVRACREDAYRPLPKVSRAWLFQIGFNLIMDWLRQKRRASNAEYIVRHDKPTKPSQEEVDQLEEVFKFYTWLPDREKEIVELILIEGLHPLEAGARLGISKAASYKAYERAIQHLRDLIREHGSLADVHPPVPECVPEEICEEEEEEED